MITLDPGLELPFAEGEVLCGAVWSFDAGLSLQTDAFVGRPNGDVLLAYSLARPREVPPMRGWTFAFGPQRTFKPQGRDVVNQYDMVVTHDGSVVRTARDRGFTRLRGRDGDFLIEASGYRTTGTLSALDGYLEKSGYGFTVVRVREDARRDHD